MQPFPATHPLGTRLSMQQLTSRHIQTKKKKGSGAKLSIADVLSLCQLKWWSSSVWPVKSRQMYLKVAQKWFH